MTPIFIAEMLSLRRSWVEITIRTIMMVDSPEMTDADPALIVQNCLPGRGGWYRHHPGHRK
jgi:hypothetical protein